MDNYEKLFGNFFGIKPNIKEGEIDSILNLIDYVLYEKYLSKNTPIFSKIPFIHPHMIPKGIRKYVSKLIANKKEKAGFPNFPFDFTVDYLRNYIKLKYYNEKKSMPFWKKNKKFAIVLSHDVDTDFIFKNKSILNSFLDLEQKYNFRSAWYFVTNKYNINHDVLKDIEEKGHEIGFHSDKHDYRLPFIKEERIRKRLDKCRVFIDKYGIKGGRSPLFLRTQEYFSVLQNYLSYDSSCHDSTIGPLSGLNEGCCSCFPFFINNLLEIPTTICEGYTLMKLGLKQEKITDIQFKKIEMIRELNGVVHLLVHPEPQISGNKQGLQIYEKFLERCSEFDDAWIILPKELDEWWRGRDKNIKNKIGFKLE